MRLPIYNSEILSVVKEIATYVPRGRRWERLEWSVTNTVSGEGIEVCLCADNGKGKELDRRLVSRVFPVTSPWEDLTDFVERLRSIVDSMLAEIGVVEAPPLPTFRIATRGKRRLQMRRAA